jgi:hypothetical protein
VLDVRHVASLPRRGRGREGTPWPGPRRRRVSTATPIASQPTFSTADDHTPAVAAASASAAEPKIEQAWNGGPSPAHRPRLVWAYPYMSTTAPAQPTAATRSGRRSEVMPSSLGAEGM